MKHNYKSAPTVFRRLEGALDSACRSRFCQDDKLGLKPEQRAFYLHLAMLWMKVVLSTGQYDLEIHDIMWLFDFQGSEVSYHVGKAWSNNFLPLLVRSQLSRGNVENLSSTELTFVIFLCWRLRVLPVKSSDRQEHLKFSSPYVFDNAMMSNILYLQSSLA